MLPHTSGLSRSLVDDTSPCSEAIEVHDGCLALRARVHASEPAEGRSEEVSVYEVSECSKSGHWPRTVYDVAMRAPGVRAVSLAWQSHPGAAGASQSNRISLQSEAGVKDGEKEIVTVALTLVCLVC